MKKVYCKNCEWFRQSYDWDNSNVCVVGQQKDNPYFTETYIDHKGLKKFKWRNKEEFENMCKQTNTTHKNGMIACCNFNLDFNCKYYKKKWWKFWVK
jgi:hypothetical protein